MPDVTQLYRDQRIRRWALLSLPVVAVGGLWLLVTQVLLVPSVPGDQASAAQVARFVMHERGLPGISQQRAERFLDSQVRRLVQNEAFRTRFIAEYRTASLEEQGAFRRHLFDVIKPIIMRDVRRFEEAEGAELERYLDQRIVAYNRLARLWGDTTISKGMLGGGALAPSEVLQFVFSRTTERERAAVVNYATALATRVEQILASPDLTAEFEARIAAVAEPAASSR